jgi:hypothetical protein
MNDEKLQALLKDIIEHTRTLNNVFVCLQSEGIRVRVSSASESAGLEHLSVRVWKEEELLQTEQ